MDHRERDKLGQHCGRGASRKAKKKGATPPSPCLFLFMLLIDSLCLIQSIIFMPFCECRGLQPYKDTLVSGSLTEKRGGRSRERDTERRAEKEKGRGMQ